MNLPNPDKIFFISDTHFGHAGIINLCGRPFRSVEEMDDQLIEMWNETIPEGALVFHLGDVSFRGKSATYGILGQLKGRIVLIRGNHDRQINSNTDSRFEEIHDYFELNLESRKIVLCHFPFESWNNMHHGSWHLHGHSHGNMRAFGKRLDVGVDSLRHYSPVSYYVIQDILDNRPVEARDHHYMSAIDRALAERDARIAVLEREVRSKRRSVKNLLSIIDDHKIDLNDPESSCYRIASYEKDGDAWPPKAAEQPWTQTQLEGQMIAESGEPS